MRRKIIYKPPGAKSSELKVSSEQESAQESSSQGSDWTNYPRSNAGEQPSDTKSSNPYLTCFGSLALVLLLGCLFSCVLPISCSPKHDEILGRVPIGSKLSDLDTLLGNWSYSESEVTKWTVADEDQTVTNEFGTYSERELGTFDRWKVTTDERKTFTGEIRFHYHSAVIPDDLDPSYIIYLVYIDGELAKKDFTILPG